MKRFAAYGRLARMMRLTSSIPNRVRRMIFLLLDALSLTMALFSSIWLRFEGLEIRHVSYFLSVWVAIIPASLLIFGFMGLYRRSVRFTSIPDLVAIFSAVTMSTMLKLGTLYFHHGVGYSRSIVIIDWILSLLLIGFSRLLPRLLLSFAEYETIRAVVFGKARNTAKRVLIFGAGHAGENVAREILRNENFPYRILGFLDDAPRKLGQVIHGIDVLGGRQDLNRIVREQSVDEVIIAIPSASGEAIREIVHLCRDTRVKFMTLPGMQEILEGKLLSMQLRDISVEDLLRRAPADINLAEIAAYVTGKTVLVTGAGGSIGGEICRQILPFQPKFLLLLGKGENSIYQIHQELLERKDLGQIQVIPIIADIRDEDRLKKLFHEHRPHIIFHAAAHKHVPLMEANPDEAVKNNVFGTSNLVRLANEFKSERFVMISTDKAVNPTSVMGATKRAAEMVMKMYAKKSATRFCAVRFGNVLGSRGSVIPLFKKQIARGGPITITHPNMIRYFMTIPEASKLVIQAGSYGKGGEVFLLDMGEPVKIADLASDLVRLAGLEEGKDIKIEFSGIRPGEKLYEELLTAEEGVTATKNKKIFIARPEEINPEQLQTLMARLAAAAQEGNGRHVVGTLKEIVPNFAPDRDQVFNDAIPPHEVRMSKKKDRGHLKIV